MLRAGLDWASATHAFCVVDAEGQRVLQGAVPHTADGLAGMLRRLASLAPPSQIPIAIERPTGLIVDFKTQDVTQEEAERVARKYRAQAGMYRAVAGALGVPAEMRFHFTRPNAVVVLASGSLSGEGGV